MDTLQILNLITALLAILPVTRIWIYLFKEYRFRKIVHHKGIAHTMLGLLLVFTLLWLIPAFAVFYCLAQVLELNVKWLMIYASLRTFGVNITIIIISIVFDRIIKNKF